jgi:hypothetical protein
LAKFLGQQKFQCHTQGTQIGHQVKQIVENLPQNYTQVFGAQYVICDPPIYNWMKKSHFSFAKWF